MSLVYFTYFEPMSGVYESQVLDVCQYLETAFSVPVTLVAVLSPRNFVEQKERLLVRWPRAKILRSPLGWRAWPIARRIVLSQITSALPLGTKAILARGPIAAALAIDLRKRGLILRVGYDGRGAVAAEWREYDVAPNLAWQSRMPALERTAVCEADIRIAVSNALIKHWRETYDYRCSAHVVIPCTLSTRHRADTPAPTELINRRRELGLRPEQIVICYAGSAAEWQSIASLDPWLDRLMMRDPRVALLMMTRANLERSGVLSKHSDRVFQIWVRPDQVNLSMEACDYGLLLREASITNRVAAPTKFAEYLAAGLNVLISPNMGDYSELVRSKGLGEVCELASEPPALEPQLQELKAARALFAIDEFSKDTFAGDYRKVLVRLGIMI